MRHLGKYVLPAVIPAFLLGVPLPVSYSLSWIHFTYGSKGLEAGVLLETGLRLLFWLSSGIIFECIFRHILLRRCLEWKAGWSGIILHLVKMNVLLAYPVYHVASHLDAPGFLHLLLIENGIQLLLALIYLRSGSIWPGGFLFGGLNAFRFVIMNDISGPFETVYFISAAEPVFHWLNLLMVTAACVFAACLHPDKAAE